MMATLHDSAVAAEVVPLAFPFTRSGYRHELLARRGRVALVERTSTHPDSRGSIHYEVVVLRSRGSRRLPDGSSVPAAEQYPPTERWGVDGWTYTSLAGATLVFDAPKGGKASTLAWARREAARRGRLQKNRPSGGEPIPFGEALGREIARALDEATEAPEA